MRTSCGAVGCSSRRTQQTERCHLEEKNVRKGKKGREGQLEVVEVSKPIVSTSFEVRALSWPTTSTLSEVMLRAASARVTRGVSSRHRTGEAERKESDLSTSLLLPSFHRRLVLLLPLPSPNSSRRSRPSLYIQSDPRSFSYSQPRRYVASQASQLDLSRANLLHLHLTSPPLSPPPLLSKKEDSY